MKAHKLFIAIFMLCLCPSFGQASINSCAGVHFGHDTVEWANSIFSSARKTRQERAEAFFPQEMVSGDLNFIDESMEKAALVASNAPQATDLDREVIQVLRQRIANMKSRDEVPMKEYALLCGHVSLALTRKIQLEGHAIVERGDYRLPVFESIFKDIVKNPMTNRIATIFPSLDGKTIRHFQELDLIPEAALANENLVFVPTARALSTYDFNRLFRIPIHFLGISNERMYIDGVYMSPFEFFMHDRDHAREIYPLSRNWDPAYQKNRDHLDELFNTNFPKIQDVRLQHTVHAYWFFIFHEKTNYRKFGTAYTKTAAIKYLESNELNGQVSVLDNEAFMTRVRNPKDLGGEFTNVPVPDQATLNQAILWIKNMLLSSP